MKSNVEKEPLFEIIEKEINEKAAILQKVELPNVNSNITVLLKREDLIHSTISGNKWRKLKYNLIEARKLGINTLLTFGGAYSNHIYATASAGNVFSFNTIGIIRGEEHLPLNPTLAFAKKCGMQIHYADRLTYRRKREQDYIKKLQNEFGDFYLLPEGGTNNLALKGCTEIVTEINHDFDYILSACGTGGTLSGIVCGMNGYKQIIGVPVLKGAEFLNDEISKYIKEFSGKSFINWKLNLEYHSGGYAKINKDLVLFIKKFEEINNIPLDPIYTGKLLFGIHSMIINNEFDAGSTIIAIHTGGLQGVAGMQNKINKLLS